jgi:hypothetical protein
MKLIISTPFYDNHAFSQYVTSLSASLLVLAKAGIDVDFHCVNGCAYIDDARNTLVGMFLATDATHLLFIDSDLQWDMESLSNVIRSDVDVCGATYRFKSDIVGYPSTINTQPDYVAPEGFCGPPITNSKGLISAIVCPTGFMLFKRCVFEKLIEKQPDNFYIDHHTKNKVYDFFGRITENHSKKGEDVSFCKRWLDCGGEIWIEPRATITHWGSKGWKGNFDNHLVNVSDQFKSKIDKISDRLNWALNAMNVIPFESEVCI